MRWFTKPLMRTAAIDRLTLESASTGVAPTTVAITAELADPNTAPPVAAAAVNDARPAQTPTAAAAAATAPPEQAKPAGANPAGGGIERVRALAVGGGSSHDFAKWFGDKDKATLLELKPAWIDYVENPSAIAQAAPNLDVLVLSTNQPLSSDARSGIMAMVNGSKGLLLYHPALWYNWNNFPEYNRELVGGGAKSHDRYGEFEVEVLDATHPITAGLPKKFKITDELYHIVPDAQGTPIQVLAQATSPTTGKTFPQVWVTRTSEGAHCLHYARARRQSARNWRSFKRF